MVSSESVCSLAKSFFPRIKEVPVRRSLLNGASLLFENRFSHGESKVSLVLDKGSYTKREQSLQAGQSRVIIYWYKSNAEVASKLT